MATKDEFLHIKINGDEKQEIAEHAETLDIPVSQFVREAVREKIATLKQPVEQAEPAAV